VTAGIGENTVPLDFTVIFFSRQHFGDNPNQSDIPGTFVGQAKDYSFDCPKLIAGETAFLLFQSMAVISPDNVFQINGVDVWGGLPANLPLSWFLNVVLVESRHQLRTTGNVLHVESQPYVGSEGRLNDFVLDNMVIAYKALVPPNRPPRPPRAI
jgi:hypothetical protein